MTQGWVRVPVGEGGAPYLSVPFERTVLVVARTYTTTAWLLDFIPELVADPRVQVVFTVEDESPSAYHRGAYELLAAEGASVIPWSQATATRFDVAICSTHTGSLENLQSRLLITPHGPGFGKRASIRAGGVVPLPRDPSAELARSGRPLTTVVLSHPEQATLFAGHPPTVELYVAGDPVFDRLSVSVHRRATYRESFGVGPAQRFIVLSSTWGTKSQLGTQPDLALRLLGELPCDEYRLGMIVHPNIWYGHSTWQVRAWLRRATDAGLVLVPPRDAWKPAVIAADLLIADHGSVGFYAASIGTPILRAGFDLNELMGRSPLALMGREAPELDLGVAVGAQIDRVIAEHDPRRYVPMVDQQFAEQGNSLARLRDAIYHLIDLTAPATSPRTLSIDAPDQHVDSVTAHHVVVSSRGPAESDGSTVLSVQRFPATSTPPPPPPPPEFSIRCLVVDVSEQETALLHSAAVVLVNGGVDARASTLSLFPGCRFVAQRSADGQSIGLEARDGRTVEVRSADGRPLGDLVDASAAAGMVYALDVSGGLPSAGTRAVSLQLGMIVRRLEVSADRT